MVWRAVIVCVAALLPAACQNQVEQRKPSGTTTVLIGPADVRTVAAVPFGHEVRITLPPPSDENHIWQISAHNWRFLQQLTDLAPTASVDRMWRVSFLAVKSGTTRVQFVLVPTTVAGTTVLADRREIVLTIE
jgi:hypothetical protein